MAATTNGPSMVLPSRRKERDNVVYWKTNRKIINDLQCSRRTSTRAFRPFPWFVLPPYLGSRWEGFKLATFLDFVGKDKSNDLDHFAK